MSDEARARDDRISARIERLPLAPWHTWMRSIVGTAMFFDAFDAVALAYVLPAIVPLWKLTPADIGAILAIGYAGQIIGSLFFGWLGERIGRVPTAVITIAIFSVFSLGCVLSPDYRTLFWMRFFQGLGLGGETPVMHAYISEFAQAKNRARFTLVFQLGFAFGILAAALAGVFVVPTLGWQWMFVIGAVPAFFALALRWMIPESPRWLASRGRHEEADRVLAGIEAIIERQTKAPLPPVPADVPAPPRAETDVRELFRGVYLRRTLVVWALWFFTYFIGYGLTGWLPTIYRTQFGLGLEEALRFSFITQAASICGSIAVAFLVDKTGRKPWFTAALFCAALPLMALWWAKSIDVSTVLLLICLTLPCVSSVSIALGMFTAENYPTHLRALGGGIAGAWLRVASVIGPWLVGLVLPTWGLGAVFVMFGVAGLLGAAVCGLFATETRGKVLERVSRVG